VTRDHSNRFLKLAEILLCAVVGICAANNAWAQACNPRQASCKPGYGVDVSGPQWACRACVGNSWSDGCQLGCTPCPTSQTANRNHTGCLPTCPATVEGAVLFANVSLPQVNIVSFVGTITNPPPPRSNGKSSIYKNFAAFAQSGSCMQLFMWKAKSTTGSWANSSMNEAVCKYYLASILSSSSGPNCSGYNGSFTVTCTGNTCNF
jgi:hypothetical protein